MIRRLVVLALLVAGALLIEPLRVPTDGVIAPRSLFLFGLLLLAADTLGALVHDLKLPRIVGYLVAGVILGPDVSGIVPESVIEDLTMTKRLAVGLIGLLAGAELRVADLTSRWKPILGILACQTVAVMVALTAAVVLGRGQIPFVAGLEWGALLVVAALFATMLTVNSPMVTIALLSETRASGPVAKTTLGVVLVADLVVIFLFTVALSAAQSAFGGTGGSTLARLAGLVWEVSGSLLAGAIVGLLLSLYLRFIKRELVVFAVVIVFATAAAARALEFELLLSLVVAGFLVENVAPVRAEPLVKALHQTAVPVFVVFFALAGAELHLVELIALAPIVALFALVRLGAIVLGARLGARWGGAEEVVRRYGWMGLVSQAGVALGLATLVAERFPGIGVAMQATVLGVIAINETLGPILFRLGLSRSGELTPNGVDPGPSFARQVHATSGD